MLINGTQAISSSSACLLRHMSGILRTSRRTNRGAFRRRGPKVDEWSISKPWDGGLQTRFLSLPRPRDNVKCVDEAAFLGLVIVYDKLARYPECYSMKSDI